MAYQIEDVIDEYLMLKQKEAHNNSDQREVMDCEVCILKMGNVLLKTVRCILDLKPKHDLACTIKDIKAELVEIQRRKESYKLVSTNSLQGGDQRQQGCQDYRGYYSTYLEDSEVLGIEKPKSDVISKLNIMENKLGGRSLIAVVGMGGVGKTTLINKVFEDKEVRKHFHLRAWVPVSQSCNPVDVLRTMLKQLLKASGEQEVVIREVDNLPYAQIILKLRYLIVLDDIWDTKLLTCIKDALPSHLEGRILMTTRKRDVACTWATSLSGHVHELLPLPPKEAWNLFCIKTFGNRDCPQGLEHLSRQIVEKCEGLPLAIVAIGGFLSTKEVSYSNWSKLLNSLGSELTRNRELMSVKRILLLSYHELPHYLKPCFLYFGLLPEDYCIAHRRLIRIWMADGLVEPQRGKTVEEVGEEYMIQLIQRNLIQVAQANVTGRHFLVRVHDILREIIISELEETGFGQLLPSGDFSMDTQFRRLTISCSSNNSLESSSMSKTNISHKTKIRSLILIGDESEQDMPRCLKVESLVKFVPLLKVLDLEGAPIHEVPEEVGNLRLLRLLNLRDTKVKTLPKSIGRLVNLETLDIRNCPIRELPKEMSQLYKLRYLHAYHFDFDNLETFGVEVPIEVLQNLSKLQKLALIDIGGEKTTAAAATMIIKELRNLKQLRKFGITCRTENMTEVNSMVQEMEHLESLSVNSARKDEIVDLQLNNKKTLYSLQCLYVYRGIMHKLPGWVAQLVNLVSLGLINSRLQEDPLLILGQLPNLAQLYLWNECYEGDQLDFGTSGFPKFQNLQILELKALKSIIGSPPPLLQQGFISRCPKLKDVPLEIRHLLRN